MALINDIPWKFSIANKYAMLYSSLLYQFKLSSISSCVQNHLIHSKLYINVYIMNVLFVYSLTVFVFICNEVKFCILCLHLLLISYARKQSRFTYIYAQIIYLLLAKEIINHLFKSIIIISAPIFVGKIKQKTQWIVMDTITYRQSIIVLTFRYQWMISL